MEITGSALTAQYQRASSAWRFIHQTELARGLPRMLLSAAGSREASFTSEVGGFGHDPAPGSPAAGRPPPGGFALVQKRTGAAPDGLFGSVTQMHVASFRSHHSLTADGIVGPQTARAPGSLPGDRAYQRMLRSEAGADPMALLEAGRPASLPART